MGDWGSYGRGYGYGFLSGALFVLCVIAFFSKVIGDLHIARWHSCTCVDSSDKRGAFGLGYVIRQCASLNTGNLYTETVDRRTPGERLYCCNAKWQCADTVAPSDIPGSPPPPR